MKMKKLLVLFALFFSVSANAQNRWSVIGGAGAGTHKVFTRDRHITDGSGTITTISGKKFDGKLNILLDAGVRYNIRMFHLQTGINYNFIVRDKNQYGGLYIDIKERHSIGVPLMIGFHYNNNNKIYPLAQIGVIEYFAVNKSAISKMFENSTVFACNAGVGINAGRIAFEPSVFCYRSNDLVGLSSIFNNYGLAIAGKLSVAWRL
jgi:hypothetical protein